MNMINPHQQYAEMLTTFHVAWKDGFKHGVVVALGGVALAKVASKRHAARLSQKIGS